MAFLQKSGQQQEKFNLLFSAEKKSKKQNKFKLKATNHNLMDVFIQIKQNKL